MDRKSIPGEYGSEGAGEKIDLPVCDYATAQGSVLQFLAVLAYPQVHERTNRDPFVEALHAAVYKARVWERRANKHDSAALRTLVPQTFREKANRKYMGLLTKGMRRVHQRINAGNIAARFIVTGDFIPVPHLARCSSISVPIMYLQPVKVAAYGIRLIAPKTVRDALRDAIKIRDKKRGDLHYGTSAKSGLDDAIENDRKNHWIPSMPVLHLGTALMQELSRFPKGNDTPPSEFLMGLIQDPTWLREALGRAEHYRQVLAKYIPESDFDPAKAIRLLAQ